MKQNRPNDIDVSRRDVLKAMGATLAMFSIPGYSMAADARKETMRVVWAYEVPTLDPAGVGLNRATWALSWQIYDRLTTYETVQKPDGNFEYDGKRVKGSLAESWTISEDGKLVTIKVRKGATFHDGAPVTAHDVHWSCQRALNMPSAKGVTSFGGMASIEQLTVIDDYTLALKLPVRNSFTMQVFAVMYIPIINSKLVQKNTPADDPWGKEYLKRNDAGGGAFKVETFRNDQVVLARHDGWKAGAEPFLVKAIFQTVPEAATRGLLIERGTADLAMEIPPNDLDAIAKRGKAKVISLPMPNHCDFLAFNTQDKPFTDMRVRQAIVYALPLKEMFNGVWHNRGRILQRSAGQSLNAAEFPPMQNYDYNLEKAKALMTEAGLQGGFKTTLGFMLNKSPYFEPLAISIKDALSKINIDVEIQKLAGPQFDEKFTARALPMAIDTFIGWVPGNEYFYQICYTGPGRSNYGNFKNAEADAILAELRKGPDPARWKELIDKIGQIAVTEIPLVPLWQGTLDVVVGKDVTGFTYWFHGYPDMATLRRV